MRKILFPLVLAITVFMPHRGHAEVKWTCALWMSTVHPLSEHKTEKSVLIACENPDFEVLDHQYAKDKNTVFFKPMPNANNMTIIVEEADPETFRTLRSSCQSVDALDKDHYFSLGQVKKDITREDFEKFCP